MQEMIEPDRTIMIVSIIALVIIWGSVAYHKFLQESGPSEGAHLAFGTADSGVASSADPKAVSPVDPHLQKSGSKKRKKKRR